MVVWLCLFLGNSDSPAAENIVTLVFFVTASPRFLPAGPFHLITA